MARKRKMLVSVVIPAYNAAEWIAETLDSVLQQTHKDLEIVVVDDGSTDRTIEVAEECLKKGAVPYRILSQPNKSAAAARNRGWQVARGSWIQFLDADDLLHPQKLELQIAESSRRPEADVIYSDWQRLVWTSAGWSRHEEIRVTEIGRDPLADVLSDKNFLQLGSQIFRASVLRFVGGFDSAHVPVEDVGLCVKIAMARGSFVKAHSTGPLSWYRDRPQSLSKSSDRRFVEACMKNAKLAEQYIRRNPDCSTKIIDAIVHAYFFGARYFADHDVVRFEEVVNDIEALRPAFVPRAPLRLRMMSLVAGYRRAERLASLYRKGKRIGIGLRRFDRAASATSEKSGS